MSGGPATTLQEPAQLSGRSAPASYSRVIASAALRWGLPAAVIAVAMAAWEAAVRLLDVAQWLLPPPSAIGAELMASRDLLLRHTWVTLGEVVLGFALALVVGVALASFIAYSRIVERAVYPFVIASQTVPVIVIAPLLLSWIGYGIWPKVIVVVLLSFFPIVVNTVDGLKSADPDLLRMMRTLGANRWQLFVKVQAPTCLPFLFSGLRVAIALSVIGAVVGEWVGASAGLGYLMTRSRAPVPHGQGIRLHVHPGRHGSGPVPAGGPGRAIRGALVQEGEPRQCVGYSLVRR